jgi:DNA polymerase III epsilon subunit-like protein
MKHHNDNLLVAVDVETTGLESGYHEIVQIAVVPLGDDFEWYRPMMFFSHNMRPNHPERMNPEAMRVIKKSDDSLDYGMVVTEKAALARFVNEGIDQDRCADLFMDWFEKLRLKPKKKLIPVGHNLQFDMPMIKAWLGKEAFEYIFDPRCRDTMGVSLFWNDVDGFRGDRCTFKDVRLGSLCVSLKVENLKAHNAFDDAIATARCYGRMVKQFNLSAVVPEIDETNRPDTQATRFLERQEQQWLRTLPQHMKDLVIQEWLTNNEKSRL